MSSFHPKPIQQQMYTRERRGIFRSTEGYDTIAKSRGLDSSFIKKVIHPFCVYDAPTELTVRGEKDAALYPAAMHLFHTDSGETVLGVSQYQAADFTGLRSAFFAHNYIISAEQSAEIVANYPSWLNASFTDSYDIERGMELAELERLPVVGKQLAASSHKALLTELNIHEKLFKQLLFAVMSAVAGKKKVYVALDVPIEHVSERAKLLLEVLYACLPHAIRRQLGFMTYANEPQSKKAIHLMFVEKGSLRPNDRNIEKDYTFDIATGRVTNVELDWSAQPYLDFAWSNLGRLERAESFYSFAELMLADMELPRKSALTSYHELAVLYQIEEGGIASYEANKSTVLRSLLDYLAPQGALVGKRRLNELFLALFKREFDAVKLGAVPEPSLVECFKDYYRLAGSGIEGALVECMIRTINNASAPAFSTSSSFASSNSPSRKTGTGVSAFYEIVEQNPALSKAFFDKLLDSGLAATLFEPYILTKFQAAPRARDVINSVQEWSRIHPQVLRLPAFADLAKGQLVDKLEREVDLVAAVNEAREQLGKLRHASLSDELFNSFYVTVSLMLLTNVKLDSLTKEQLLQMDLFKQAGEVSALVAPLEQRLKSKAAVMQSAYRWFSERAPDETVFDGITSMEMDSVQQLGRSWLQHEVEPTQFERMVLAYYRIANDDMLIEYGALLHFVHKHAKEKQTVYAFINWSAKHPDFTQGRKLHPTYAAAILTYFKKHDRDAFKKRSNRKQYFNTAVPTLKVVYDKAKLELSSPLIRFFSRSKRSILLGSIISVSVAVIGAGAYYGLQAAGVINKDKGPVAQVDVPALTPVDTEASKEAGATSKDPKAGAEEPLVYVEQVQGSGKAGSTGNAAGKGGKMQMVFRFASEQVCQSFSATSIVIEKPDGTNEAFGAFNPVSMCDAKSDDNPVKANKGSQDGENSSTSTANNETAGSTQNNERNESNVANNNSKAAVGEGEKPQTLQTPQDGQAQPNLEAYPYSVTFQLGTGVDIPKDSKVRIGEKVYPLLDMQSETVKKEGSK
ncbi:GAP1-N2 domain-containing protein [Paenibacillus sp. 481]|uniref:GAP1-N2 domain-containing protein n=1 Tax=Paenibacillus sp. 481 TaxID=2835869 RepID=UPI001E5BC9F6|nr:glycosyltransferase [Paenibacillus sp. 481]UHA75103.1 glycosyltransferase [Paenibacillus sp. 481]